MSFTAEVVMISLEKPSLEHFFRTWNVTDFAVRSDEQQIIYSTNINGYYNLWAMNLNTKYPFPITIHNQMVSFIQYDPQHRYIWTGFDQDGDENTHVYAVPIQGGNVTPVLKQSGEKFYFSDLSSDGQRLYYETSVDNPSFLNISRYHVESGEIEVLIKGDIGPIGLMAVSPNESSFAYVQSIGNTKAFGYLKKHHETVLMTPSDQVSHRVGQAKYVDDSTVLFLTNYEREYSYLASFHIETQVFQVLAEIEGYELTELQMDRKRGKVYLIAERGVSDELYVYDLHDKTTEKIPSPVDIIDKIIVGEQGGMYLIGRSATSPNNLYCRMEDKDWERLTQHGVIGIEEVGLSEPESLIYPSFDGKLIDALYFKPRPERDNGHTILWPHGGPQHAERKSFRALFQYLCYQGYRIFAPNFRGSTGYGESFLKLVNKDWGGGPRLDLVAGMNWLNDQGKSEAGKWFCVGGSFGGYMTLLLHGRHAHLFKAFVDLFGPSNLFTTIETAPEHWKTADAELIGDRVKDREKLIEDSPMTYIDHMTQPMLVIQGANDPRVVKVESDVIVEALRKKGRQIEYLVLDDEGHGFSKTENAIKVYRTVTEFLDRLI
jgi:dipeptidyl aminopeptidase/acylaminoacyl peptidase